jgi:hypothetical protein
LEISKKYEHVKIMEGFIPSVFVVFLQTGCAKLGKDVGKCKI